MMLLARSLAVTEKTDFPLRITNYSRDCEMVMRAASYAAVTVALVVVLCTHCNSVWFAFIADKDEGVWGPLSQGSISSKS